MQAYGIEVFVDVCSLPVNCENVDAMTAAEADLFECFSDKRGTRTDDAFDQLQFAGFEFFEVEIFLFGKTNAFGFVKLFETGAVQGEQ